MTLLILRLLQNKPTQRRILTMNISIISSVHLVLLLISVVTFLIRGVLMLTGSTAMNSKPLLGLATLSMLLILASGISLVILGERSFTDSFIITKMIGLTLYVVLGILSLRPNTSKLIASILWLLGLAAFAYTYLFVIGMVPALLG